MLKKTLTLAMFAALACNCAFADGDTPQAQNAYTKNATGKIVFDGYVTLPGVVVKVITNEENSIINTGLNGKSVDMGVPDVEVGVLKATPANGEMASGSARSFRIELEGYSAATSGIMTAEVVVTGDPIPNSSSSIYANEILPENGGATGVGIRVREKGIDVSGTPRTFTNGEPLVGRFDEDYVAGRDANYAFHFDASIVAVDPVEVSAGHVKSTIDVVVNYK